MKFDKNTSRILLIGAIILIFFGMQNTLPKQTVADVEGLACTKDTAKKDCPCWGEIKDGPEAFGIGVGSCIDCSIGKNQNRTGCIKADNPGGMACDMSYCFDVQPAGEWMRDKPLAWATDPSNVTIVIGIIGLLLLLIFWPKQ